MQKLPKDSSLSGSRMNYRQKKLFSGTIIEKIFEKKFRFHVKWCTARKSQYMVLSNILLEMTKYLFREGDWAQALISSFNFEVFVKLANLLRYKFVPQVLMQLVYIVSISDNNHATLHLWQNKNLVKYQKVSKYYDHLCLQNFLFLLMSLATNNYNFQKQ